MQIVSNVALISINETFLVQLISFLIFLFIINRVMIRPLRGVMREREEYVEKLKLEMVDAEKELEDTAQHIRSKETEVIKAAHQIREKIENRGSREAADIVAAAKDEVNRLTLKADKEVSAMIAEAQKSIQDESEVLAVNIMEKILDRRLVG
jgi:F-type H+-transporting ATPase subunit b